MITIELNDASLNDVLTKLKRYNKNVKDDVNKQVLSSAMRITAESKSNIKKNRSVRTSVLFKSIDYRFNAAKHGGYVYTNVFYAPFVEEGRGPVVVRNKRVLAAPIKNWGNRPVNPYGSKNGLPMLSKDGKYVILGRRVRAAAPKPFIRPAADKERPIYIERLKQLLIKNM